MSTDTSTGLLGWYERFLWGMMDALGVSKSIERKILTATMLQFGAILAIIVLGVGLLGVETFLSMFTPLEMAAFGGVFVLAIIALLNTILILPRDFIAPIKEIEAVAKSVADGELDRSVPDTEQRDEIGSLVGSVSNMHEYLLTVSAQAAALSREQFDAPILEQSVPGSFGAALDRMEVNLEERIEDLERQRGEIETRNRVLTEAAEDYTRTISRVADGDLTERLDESVDHEVMKAVAEAFNDMVAEWESMMSELRSFAREVASESDRLRTNADEVRNASEDISGSVQEISDGVDRESRRLETASSETENLSATIQEITASADTVATLTDETAEFGSEGRAAAEDAKEEMAALREQSDDVTAAFEELDRTIEEIGDITDVILDIADQTNILALNAGIEAARAESGGEGFAVVAEEVKSLAQETKESAEKIETLIDDVHDASSNTVEEIEHMRERVESGSETVETTTEAFASMAENVSEINTSIQEVNDATAEQAESMQDVVAMVEDIASISDGTAAEAETVAAAAEEQAATLNQVAENTGDLAEDAGDLEASLGRFEVGEGREYGVGLEGGETDSTASRPMDRKDKSTSEHGNAASADAPAGGGDTDSNVARADTSVMEWQSVVTDGGDGDS